MIIYIDMDDVLCNFTRAFKDALVSSKGIEFPQSQYGFYANLDPIINAIESVKYLSSKYEVYILTAPSFYNPLSYTEKRVWIEKHFDLEFTKKLIISHNKGLLKGDFLIDDRSSGHGQDEFGGKLLLFGSDDYHDWDKIIRYFDFKDSLNESI